MQDHSRTAEALNDPEGTLSSTDSGQSQVTNRIGCFESRRLFDELHEVDILVWRQGDGHPVKGHQ